MQQQIKSRQRVTEHGEVFTAEREVKAMCDLVKQETERIDSRFLEPACGTGNFLTEILARKLSVVKSEYSRSPLEYEKYSLLAVSSLYGVDIMADNVETCRERCLSSGTSNTDPSAKKNATMIQENPSALSCQKISSAETPLLLSA